MKSRLFASILALMLCCTANINAQSPADSLTFIATDWQWKDLGKGAQAGYAQVRIFDSVQSISVVRYPAGKFRTSIVHAPEDLCNTTDSLARRSKARFACNGSYFNVKKLTPDTFFSLGHKVVGVSPDKELYRSNGVIARRCRCSRSYEIFYYDGNELETYRRKYHEALASGPVLVLDGESPDFPMERSFYYLRHPRTFVGMVRGKNPRQDMIYMVVIDGRFPGQGDGASIPEMAAIARYFGCDDALNLDGGGSSTVWTDQTGVINHPYDNHQFDHAGCRKVPNILIAK